MAGNAHSAAKVAAGKLGMPVDLYIAKRAAGERYCYVCRSWKLLEAFYSARRAMCRQCNRVPHKAVDRITDREVMLVRQLHWIGKVPYVALAKMFDRSMRSIWSAAQGHTRPRLPMPWEDLR